MVRAMEMINGGVAKPNGHEMSIIGKLDRFQRSATLCPHTALHSLTLYDRTHFGNGA